MLTRDPQLTGRYAETFRSWHERGRPCRFLRADALNWRRLKEELDCVVVRDAGVTEVEPGSETVLACPPASLLDGLPGLRWIDG
jgi:peptidyl-tRNA hydrolase